ncbi:hypothetical protein [Janthinobacterium sp.]|uniref:hypothetical protein n=1 Tax=Janthinobacterium sp. TaxID=1871054 RepID=UPI0028A2A53D|nr:hypothetical protein [Janthinobacterium sp.]
MNTCVKAGVHALLAGFIVCAAQAAWAAPKGTADEAVAMIEKIDNMIVGSGIYK